MTHIFHMYARHETIANLFSTSALQPFPSCAEATLPARQDRRSPPITNTAPTSKMPDWELLLTFLAIILLVAIGIAAGLLWHRYRTIMQPLEASEGVRTADLSRLQRMRIFWLGPGPGDRVVD